MAAFTTPMPSTWLIKLLHPGPSEEFAEQTKDMQFTLGCDTCEIILNCCCEATTGDGSALQEAQNGIVLLVILSANAEQYVKAVTSVSRYEATWQVFRLQECFEAPRIPLAILEAQLVHLQNDVASDTVIAKQFSFGRLQFFRLKDFMSSLRPAISFSTISSLLAESFSITLQQS